MCALRASNIIFQIMSNVTKIKIKRNKIIIHICPLDASVGFLYFLLLKPWYHGIIYQKYLKVLVAFSKGKSI